MAFSTPKRLHIFQVPDDIFMKIIDHVDATSLLRYILNGIVTLTLSFVNPM
jgi:hypothetical protein